IIEVLSNLLMSVVDNPVNALINANYIGILAWAVATGFALRHAHGATKNVMADLSMVLSFIVKAVIRLAPIGIFGLVAATIAEAGLDALLGYAQLLAVLIGCMLFVALAVNPLIVFAKIRRNPYPLVFTDRKSTRLNSSHVKISYAVFCLKKKKIK